MKKRIKKRAPRNHTILIPHLGTQVIVHRKLKGDNDHAAAYVKRVCADEYFMSLKLPIVGWRSARDLVHEIIHILQFIVEDNHMKFEAEREHLAYVAEYIFEEVCKL